MIIPKELDIKLYKPKELDAISMICTSVYVFHHIDSANLKNYKVLDNVRNGLVNIPTTSFIKMFSSNAYLKYVNLCKGIKINGVSILETDDLYIPPIYENGVKVKEGECKKYKLFSYNKKDFIEYKFKCAISDKSYIELMTNNINLDWEKSHSETILKKLKIRYKDAIYFAENFDKYQEPLSDDDGNIILDEYGKSKYKKLKIVLDAINNIHTNVKWCNRCEYRRLHHNLTNLHSDIRQFIYFDNPKETLYQLDINNSQMFFFASMFDKNFYNTFIKDNDNITKYFKSVILDEDNKNDETIPQLTKQKDFLEFRELCYTGTLWDVLMEKFGVTNRKELKQGFFRIVYSKINHDDKPNKGWTSLKYKELDLEKLFYYFKDTYPSVYNIMKRLKMNSHAELATSLQLIESEIMIDTLLKKCIIEYGYNNIFTIHDSISANNGEIRKIKTIFLNIFKKIGCKEPNIKIEKL